MDHVHLDQVTPGTLAVLVAALVLVWLLYKATKHLVLGLLCLGIALAGVGYWTGVLSPVNAVRAAESAGKNGLQAAEIQVKRLGEQARKTAE